MSLSRRRLLGAGAGLTAGALTLPSWLAPRLAAAEPGRPPRRIVFVCHDNGTVYDQWRMLPPGRPFTMDGDRPAPEGTDWEEPLASMPENAFSTILRPLYPMRSKMLVLDGLAMLTALGDRGGVATHAYAMVHALTGSNGRAVGLDVYAESPSVDQLIARQIARPDRYKSLALGTGRAAPISFLGDYKPLYPKHDPAEAFARMFETPVTPASREAVRLQRSSIVRKALAEYDRLIPALGADDRRKLELHRDLLRDLERRVDSVRAISCERPPAPEAAPPATELGVGNNYLRVTDAMMHLVASAFACDLTRVVTLHLDTLPAPVLGFEGDTHNDYAHKAEYASQPLATAFMTRYHTYYARRLRDLASMLDNIPEADGTLLDHTIIVWMSEVSRGVHGYDRWPIVILGGGGAGLRTGRYVRYQPRTPTPMPRPQDGYDAHFVGPAHSKLLVALAKAMGTDIDRVGRPSVTSAPIKGRASVELDLTGPLPGILA
jgi:hypothetical protein